jgi:hypothetical protein
VIGFFLRAVEALPLYRRVDAGANVAKNQNTFAACFELLARGRCIALFPEGVSHNEPKLLPIKTGAARIALGAISLKNTAGETPIDLQIIPVGLYYTSKTSFRSEALLRFGEPLKVFPVELDEDGEPPRETVRELSAQIEAALRSVTLNAETEEQLEVAARAERLFSSIYEGINLELPLAQRFDFLRRFVAGRLVSREPARLHVEKLQKSIFLYEEKLRRIGLQPENLSLSNHSYWFVFRHFLLRTGILLLLLPLTIVGALLHLPAYLLCTLLAWIFPKHGIDDITPTVKILAAMLFMPLTWVVVTIAVYFWWDWRAALAAFPFSILCGYAAMRSLEEIYDLRGWFKAVFLLLRRRQLFLRLLLQRSLLHNELKQLENKAEI